MSWFRTLTPSGCLEFLKDFKKSLITLIEIKNLLLKYRTFFLTGAVVVGGYFIAVFIVGNMPTRVVSSYYGSIYDNGDVRYAWTLLAPKLQELWNNWAKKNGFPSGEAFFMECYRTTVAHSDIEISPRASGYNLLTILLRQSQTFDVSYVAKDHFTKDDLAHPIQKTNRRWLELKMPNDVASLEQGTLDKAQLELRRKFEMSIDVALVRNSVTHEKEWKICGFQAKSTSLLY